MTQVYEVPIGPLPQIVTIPFPNGTNYRLTIDYLWQATDPCWLMDIADSVGAPILCGLPLVGADDLLRQFAYLNFGCKLWCTVDGDYTGALVPGPFNLGPALTAHLWLEG